YGENPWDAYNNIANEVDEMNMEVEVMEAGDRTHAMVVNEKQTEYQAYNNQGVYAYSIMVKEIVISHEMQKI
ncbi:hypothetical protein KI387_030055, partial [Taxus chinensis]